MRRAARPLAAVAVAVLVAAGCGDDDATDAATTTTERVDPVDSDAVTDPTEPATSAPSTTAPAEDGPAVDADTVIEVTVSGDDIRGGGRQAVPLGDTVALVVTADADDEIHVHGYELYADVVAGEPAVVTFTADLPGVWEVELHDAALPLVELEVS